MLVWGGRRDIKLTKRKNSGFKQKLERSANDSRAFNDLISGMACSSLFLVHRVGQWFYIEPSQHFGWGKSVMLHSSLNPIKRPKKLFLCASVPGGSGLGAPASSMKVTLSTPAHSTSSSSKLHPMSEELRAFVCQTHPDSGVGFYYVM